MSKHDPAPVRGYRRQLSTRFPTALRRQPVLADMEKLRELLKAAGGDLDALTSWAAAVRDTDDGAAAMVAFDARQELARLRRDTEAKVNEADAAIEAAAGRMGVAISKLVAEQMGRPGRPRRSSYAAIDDEMLSEANRRFCATRRPPMEIVREVVREFAAEGRAIGQSEDAAARRLFSLIRPSVIHGGHWRWTEPPERWDLEIAHGVSARRCGVRKMGRPVRS